MMTREEAQAVLKQILNEKPEDLARTMALQIAIIDLAYCTSLEMCICHLWQEGKV